jgi:hypothetical protein
MRQWLQFSDAAAGQAPVEAVNGGKHRRRPSLHAGTPDEVLDKVGWGEEVD